MLTAIRIVSRACVACLAIVSLGLQDAAAADQKFETPVGTIVIDIDPQWRATTTAAGITGIAYEVGGGGRSMNFMLGTMDEVDGAFDAAMVRKLAEELRASESTDGKTTTAVQDYTGTRSSGVYFQATSAPGKVPGPGEYRWMIAGLVHTNGAPPFAFTIAWNEDGKAAADRAFAAVRGLRFGSR